MSRKKQYMKLERVYKYFEYLYYWTFGLRINIKPVINKFDIKALGRKLNTVKCVCILCFFIELCQLPLLLYSKSLYK